MPNNNFLQFCGTDTGTNLESQADYAIDPNRPIGNQPGIASSKFVNKAIRQSAAIASQIAQYVSNTTKQDVLDDGNMPNLLALMSAAFSNLTPTTQSFSANGTYNISYRFATSSANATLGATYTNNGVTYTVMQTLAAGTDLWVSGNGDPTFSGTLTKASGTGDATITFVSFRKPSYLRAKAMAAGGGGSGSGTSAGVGGNGGTTSLGSIISANGGTGGTIGIATGGAGGTAGTIASPAFKIYNIQGSDGGASSSITNSGAGGNGFLGGGGGGVLGGNNGSTGKTGTGGGGSGAGINSGAAGSGGGAGNYIEALVYTPASTYAVTIGSGGSAGTAGGSGGLSGGVGATGSIVIEEYYQ